MRVSVRDNGCGMSREVAERVFEPFFTTKPVGKGTGLGLATVWHLVSEMGGRLDVESELGEGTVFHICIPLRPDPAVLPKPVAESVDGLVVPPGQRLLVVEDEPQIAELISFLLEAEGHEVTRAPNGRVGWDMLSSDPSRFDGVVMDLNMPEMSGLDLARRARALPFTKPFIVMSGRVSEDEHADLQSLGISIILNKPFDSIALKRAMSLSFGVRQVAGEAAEVPAQKY
jgi:CheY-like chemotaxis protein